MKNITKMSDTQKDKFARWLPTVVAIFMAIGGTVFNVGYTTAKIDALDIRTKQLEEEQKGLGVLIEKIKNVESNTEKTAESVEKLNEDINNIFKNYELKRK